MTSILPNLPIDIPDGTSFQQTEVIGVADITRQEDGDKAVLLVFKTAENPCTVFYLDMALAMQLHFLLSNSMDKFKKESN